MVTLACTLREYEITFLHVAACIFVSPSHYSAQMVCAVCGKSHGAGETANDLNLFESLLKNRRVYVDKKWLRLECAKTLADLDPQLWLRPLDIYNMAGHLNEKYPAGIVFVHLPLRACVRFRADKFPELLGLSCAIELLKCRLVLGLAVCQERLSVVQIGRYNKRYLPDFQSAI